MHITRVHINGFKRLINFDLALDPKLNVIVGDNETGKTSILEAIFLVLNGQYDGRSIAYTLDPYLFNVTAVANYFDKIRRGENAHPPSVLIEAYLQTDGADSDLAKLNGTNNSRSEDCPGLVLAIEVENDHVESLKTYARDDANPVVIPIEFYKVTWRSFSGSGVTLRNLPFRTAIIDTSVPRIHRGPNKYLSQVVNDILSDDQRRQLSLAYKKLRHGFAQQPEVTAINSHLQQQGNPATRRNLSVQMDMSARSTWESGISAHLDDLPFDCAGRGEQCRIHMRLAIVDSEECRVLLIEEPENPLSHSHLSMLMDDIKRDCGERQVILTTHSAFVLNKLGIDSLRLLSHSGQTVSLRGLTPDTKNYFMKLPGYDTLRLILSKKSILVEGPSDELVLQKAYRTRHGKLPLEDGVDVISVGSLAFKRFLEIARLLSVDARVVTYNDGDVAALTEKYAGYLNGEEPTIRICYDADESCRTLEPQLLKVNSRNTLNSIFGKSFSDDGDLLNYMRRSKTDCALTLWETEQHWIAPQYIEYAIN